MHFTSSSGLAALAAFPFAMGQMVHQVSVGAGGALAYDPQTITASVGDIVQFNFAAKNHTASQSAFASPCTPLIGADGVTPSGFDSGFKPVAAGSAPLPSANFTVQVTTPLWFYCRQIGHCAAGMVFAVNPPAEGNTFDKFKAAAMAGVSATSSTASTSAAATTTTASSASYSTPPAPTPVTVTVTETVSGSVYTSTYASYSGSPQPTPNPQPVVHQVTVGGTGKLTFSPSNITAQPRDVVVFKFLTKNHTATQSSFSNPCRPLGDTTSNTGFDSGFMPASSDDLTSAPVFNVTVNDTAPIWVFCKQANHCGSGMVFSVNSLETTANTFQAFQDLAKHINGTAASSSGTGTSAAPSSTNSSKPNSAMIGKSGVGAGLALGLGGVVLGALFAL